MFAVFPAFAHAPAVFHSFGFGSNSPTIVAFLLYQMILSPVEALFGVIMNAISRHFEWQADRFACELAERVRATKTDKTNVDSESFEDIGPRLGRALIALHAKNLSTMHVDWLYSAYHHSHPTLIERLDGLKTYEVEKTARSKKD